MDLFFVPSHGDPFTMEVGYFNTVLEMKEKIQKYQGIPVSNQTLISNGNTLPDGLVVCYSEIVDCSTIDLLISPDADPTPPPPPPSTKIQLLLKVSSSIPGKPLEADIHDTIKRLKEKIQEMGGVHASQIVMHANGIELQDLKTVKDCGLSDNSEINVAVRPVRPVAMDLFFQPSHGNPFSMQVSYFNTVLQVKEMIQKYKGISVSKQTLIFNGNTLPDDLVCYMEIPVFSRINLFISPDADPTPPPPPSTKIQLLLKASSSKPGKPLEADIHDTIKRIKEKIQEMEGVHASQIVVHANGTELQDLTTVKDCGLSDNSEINVAVRPVAMDLFFQPSHGNPFSIEVGYFNTVLEVKEMIQNYQGISVSKQTLIFNGNTLPDDLVCYMEIPVGSRINLLISPDADPTPPPPPPPSTKIQLLLKASSSKPGNPLEADIHDTIKRLKENIQEMGGVHASQIVMHANGIELQDLKTVKDCGLSDNSEINVAVRPVRLSRQSSTKIIKVIVLTYRGKEKVLVEVSPSDIVAGLREKIEKMKLDLPKEYFFIHKQSVMEDDQSFEFHQVRQGDKIEVFPGSVSRRPISGEQW